MSTHPQGAPTDDTESVKRTRRPHVLVVDDEAGIRESLRIILRDEFELSFAETGEEALRKTSIEQPDAVLLDIVLPGMDGIATLERLRAEVPHTPVVMVTATRTLKTAVTAIKLGAYDYVQKPFDLDELKVLLGNAVRTSALQREVDELRAEVGRRYQVGNIVGRSKGMQDVFRTVSMVAPLRTTVLITGESGTGKELIAKALHYQSPRAGRPMTAINCAAIPESLLESELFGHERGAFTGADTKKLGLFELANNSTIFLDEIGELHPTVQAKLLRVLETGEFIRVGGTRSVSTDVRIVAASNRNLEEGSRDGSFRADLYYRLNVVSMHLPPLRERRVDLALLIRHFAQAKAVELGIPERTFAPKTIDLLLRYRWPGNVRELENLVERLLVLATQGPITPEELPVGMREAPTGSPEDVRAAVLLGTKSLSDAVDGFERDIISLALQVADFNQTRAAERLGTTRRILKYRMDKLGIGER
ncbi:MAG: sigma-54 dependent transcriptional regulator [Candidatus Binatia bacterium]|nr:sigma-54 dependent transcriptional regulator [Candidatus Binatia bacterium]